MNAQAEPVTVMILDREYAIACSAEERTSLIEAAHRLDKQMRDIRDSGRLMALERIAVMAALNLTDQVIKAEESDRLRTNTIDSKIRVLADQLDSALDADID